MLLESHRSLLSRERYYVAAEHDVFQQVHVFAVKLNLQLLSIIGSILSLDSRLHFRSVSAHATGKELLCNLFLSPFLSHYPNSSDAGRSLTTTDGPCRSMSKSCKQLSSHNIGSSSVQVSPLPCLGEAIVKETGMESTRSLCHFLCIR